MLGSRFSAWGGVGVILVVGSGCTASSDYAVVEVERQGALGFCIEPGNVLDGRVDWDAAASWSFLGTVHLGWEEETPECPSYCQVTEPAGPVQLTVSERKELDRLLGRLPEVACEPSINPVCDPCLVTIVTVDGVRHDGNPCGSGCEESKRAVQAIGELFDSIAR